MLADLASMRDSFAQDGGVVDAKGADTELSALLQRLRADVERLAALRGASGRRDIITIQLQSDNAGRLRDALNRLDSLRRALEKDSRKLPANELAERRHRLVALGEELQTLAALNSGVSLQQLATHALERELLERHSNSQQERHRQKQERRRARSTKRSRSGELREENEEKRVEAELGEIRVVAHEAVASEQELAFEQQVQRNVERENELLCAIGQGLDELRELALESRKQLHVQEQMLEQVDEKMDDQMRQFRGLNRQLNGLLERSGGLARWCPLMICALLFLALLGYAFHVVQ